MLGPHAPFILAAYGTAILLISGLIGWIVRVGQVQRRLLAELEARGVRRRSARGGGATDGKGADQGDDARAQTQE